MKKNTAEDKAKLLARIGRNAFESIKEMVDALNVHDPQDEEYQTAREAIEQDPLSLEVRSDWHSPGETGTESEYCLLLATGGPAVRIVGELDRGEPSSARLETQDWFTPWTEYTQADESVLLEYARCFYFSDN